MTYFGQVRIGCHVRDTLSSAGVVLSFFWEFE